MRALFGCGTPRGARGASKAFLFVVQTDVALVIALVAEFDGERAMLLIVFTPEGADRPGWKPTSSPSCYGKVGPLPGVAVADGIVAASFGQQLQQEQKHVR